MNKKKMIAMILAGGQGSRLYVLTKDLAKPAVPYGGKYRIIDFPLSNCVNSGVDTVGVLTQYEPLELSEYIGNGQPWDLDRMGGGVFVLPPYQRSSGSDWYSGTANAIYQNMNFIDRYDPEYVAILSGDHIYKMDYSEMLEAHRRANAAATIAVCQVPWEEAPRFGIMNTDENGDVVEFEEKPKKPKSNLASMGIYIFTTEKLRKYLEADAADQGSQNDFGKNVIPAMLAAGEKLATYRFEGYWKDVGTIDSLWEANMDVLDPRVPLDLYDPEWKIYARTPIMPPHWVMEGASVQNSMITEGCVVGGTVDFTILSAGVTVEPGAVVRDSIVMPNASVKAGAVVEYAIIAEGAVICEDAKVGMRPEDVENKDEWGVAVVGPGVKVGAGAVVKPKQIVGRNVPAAEKEALK